MDDVEPLPVVNAVGPVSGPVIQAGTIHGDVHVSTSGRVPVRPRQLPDGGGHFTGRADELAQLDRLLLRRGTESPPIALLTGMAGTGKTALAVRWAHRAATEFPDGQLYADLRGFGPDVPLPPEETLAMFLRALGLSRPEELPTAAERAAHFRSLLSTRRVLVVLDNVLDEDQIRPLLPGAATCAALVVSRRQLSGLVVYHSAERVDVESLPDGDAVAVLESVIGDRVRRDRANALLLARRCAGLPLALRIVAERVAVRPRWGLDEIARQLDGERARLNSLALGGDGRIAVRTAFSWTYRELSAGQAAAFRAVGRHPGRTFDTRAAAALFGSGEDEARLLLDDLAAAHLVLERSFGRYEMHDLLRLYAAELGERHDDAAASLLRLYDHYLHTADQANRLLMPHRLRFTCPGTAPFEADFDGREAAIGWLDEELPNLVAMCRLTGPDHDLRCWHLAYTMRDHFFLTKRLDAWIETHTLAWHACERTGDVRAEARTRCNLGRALLESGDLEAAAGHYEWARERFGELGDDHGRSNALANLASIFRRRGEFERALTILGEALSFYRESGARRNTGITLRSTARVETELGRFPDATGHAESALKIAIQLELDLDAAQACVCLGQAQAGAGDLRAAQRTFARAIGYSRRAGSRYEEARALWQSGKVAARMGEPCEAKQRWQEALALYRELGLPAAEEVERDLAALPAG